MKLSSIHSYQTVQTPNFGQAFVTLSRKNLGEKIAQNVDTYNNGDFKTMYRQSRIDAQNAINEVNQKYIGQDVRIKTVKDLQEKTDFFVLAAGAGSRFMPMAKATAELRGQGESFNKISIPFELEHGQPPLTMLDIPMAMGRFFAKQNGYNKIIAEKPTGSFGDIINHYLLTGKKPKDVVVCCGDNVFDINSAEMLKFIVGTINNPDKQLGVVGVARTPKQVAGRFGVLKVGTKNPETGLYSLEGFVEKPPINEAKKLTTEDGNCVANTGMFVIKKESMEKLINIIRNERRILGGKTMYIAKDPVKEIYDFAAATKWTQAINGAEASDVKIVKTWEDVGEPKAYLRWGKQLKNGHYLENFTHNRRSAILEATKKRIGANSIQFSINPKGKTTVDGIEIKA